MAAVTVLDQFTVIYDQTGSQGIKQPNIISYKKFTITQNLMETEKLN